MKGWVLFAVAIVAFVGYAVYENVNKKERRDVRAEKHRQIKEERRTQWLEAMDAPIQISEQESVRRLRIFDQRYPAFFTVCYIYTHQAHKTSHFVCPPEPTAISLTE